MEKLYLSRRNILTLFSKLDRQKAGDATHCTITKNDTVHKKYPATFGPCSITAVEYLNSGTENTKNHIYLSREGLDDLLETLDGKFCITVRVLTTDKTTIDIIAVDDKAYYQDRSPGQVHPADDPTLKD